MDSQPIQYNTINRNTKLKQLDVTYQTRLLIFPNGITMTYSLPLNKMDVVTVTISTHP